MPVEPLTEPNTSPSVASPDDGGAIRILPSPNISSSPHLLDKPTALCVTIHVDGLWMYNRWGIGMSESEKITINLGPVDLGVRARVRCQAVTSTPGSPTATR